MAKAKPQAPTQALDLPSGPWTREQAIDTLQAHIMTEHPAPEVLAAFRQALADIPTLWRVIGDVAQHAQQAMLERYARQPLVQEGIRGGITAISRELGRAEAPMLEKLLIDQVVVCWLNVYDVQQRYAKVHAENNTLTLGEYYEKRLSAAQKRYLRACETLARVRKLSQVQPLQVNIGGQQINVVGGSVPSGGPGAALPAAAAPAAGVFADE